MIFLMMNKKIITILGIVVIFSNELFAQLQSEYSLHFGGGISTLSYKPIIGKYKAGYGPQIGFTYLHAMDKQFAIGTGLELTSYKSEFEMPHQAFNFEAKDLDGETFTLRTQATYYAEKQEAFFLQVPVMIYYIGDWQKPTNFYGAIGGKIGLPIVSKYENNYDFATTAYYLLENIEYEHPFIAMGRHQNKKTEDLTLDIHLMLSLQAGMRFKIAERWWLYAGLYVDYSVNSFGRERQKSNLIRYNTSGTSPNYQITSIIDATDDTNTEMTTAVRTLSAGVTIRIALRM
jgi:hypothetical protein